MTSEQINLIQQNFDSIAPRAEAVATVFYNRLFAMKPVLKLLFPADLTEQKQKLMKALAVAIKSLRETEKLLPFLENLGRRHALHGVREDHYDTVGAALLLTLRDALGREFTSEAHSAWAEMYGFVAATMKRAARELSAEGERLEIGQPENARSPVSPAEIKQSEINFQETKKNAEKLKSFRTSRFIYFYRFML
jgi:nitric oxide dioxygenase